MSSSVNNGDELGCLRSPPALTIIKIHPMKHVRVISLVFSFHIVSASDNGRQPLALPSRCVSDVCSLWTPPRVAGREVWGNVWCEPRADIEVSVDFVRVWNRGPLAFFSASGTVPAVERVPKSCNQFP